MKINYLLLILCLSFLISACVSPAAKPNFEPKQGNGAKIVSTKTMDASELLSFAESYSNLPQEAQKLELGNTNQTLALNPNDLLNRMKLVMILGLPSSNFADTPKAQGLLQQLLQENILTNAQLAFAHVLFDYLIVVNKGGKNDQKHDALQQKNETLQLKLEATQQKLDAAQLKLEVAQQKLGELKNIEKSMGAREAVPKTEAAPKTEPIPKK